MIHRYVFSFSRVRLQVGTACCLLLAQAAHATEGGGSTYPMGVEAHMMGAFPPEPGFYSLNYAQHYEAHRLRGNDGERLPNDFRLRADVFASRFVWVTDQKFLGGRVGVHALVPIVDLHVEMDGRSDSDKGIGDMTFGALLGYNYSKKLHSIFAIDIIAPTGSYDEDKLANIGRNYWAIEPVAAFTWVDPQGFNADIKLMYDFNFENGKTDYKSGQEFHFDYDAGWAVGDKWVLGVGGYAYWQTTDDRQHGDRVDDNKGRAMAIGPAVKYSSKDGWFMSLKWQKEYKVRNRPEGDAVWLKFTVPLMLL